MNEQVGEQAGRCNPSWSKRPLPYAPERVWHH